MNPEDRKHVLRMIDHGLFILGAGQGADAVANGVTWLMQASFSPPLIMVAIRANGRLHDMVTRTGVFSVNVVGSDQQEMVQAFFNSAEVQGDRMNGYVFEPGPATGSPLFPDTPAWFEARVQDTVKGGDHTVFVAEVIEAGVRDAAASALHLSDTPWQYGG
ncbi:MAG TPA: flavin reductase family protein [Caldilineae bacterium]|nr:flavin reductase family protein [Caldilineae bacterium]